MKRAVNKKQKFLNAAYHNDSETMKLLLGTDTVNFQNEDGWTALHYIACNNNSKMVKLLLECHGVDVNYQDRYGDTALYWAAINNNNEIAKLLLARGARVCVSPYSSNEETRDVLRNWKTYLPKWNRFKTCYYYPSEFNQIAFQWLLCCKRLKGINKDMRFLILEYFAEIWKVKTKNIKY